MLKNFFYIVLVLFFVGCQSFASQKSFYDESLGISFSYPSNWPKPEIPLEGLSLGEEWRIYFGPKCSDCWFHPVNSRTPASSAITGKYEKLGDIEYMLEFILMSEFIISDTKKGGSRIIRTKLGVGFDDYPQRYYIVLNGSLYFFSADEKYITEQEIEAFLLSFKEI